MDLRSDGSNMNGCEGNEHHRLGRPLPRSVVILKALQLGDLLCAVPALRALRAALPAANITLVGLPWARSFVERFPKYIDGFIEFPGYPGLPERMPLVRELPRFLGRVQSGNFDLALQLHGSGSFVNPLTVLFGAKRCAGFYVPGGFCPDSERFLPYPEDVPEIGRNLRLMEFLGIPSRGERLEFPVTDEDRRELAAIPGAGTLRERSYVCIHPGARLASRRWPVEKFAVVAQKLSARGFSVVITGSEEEKELTGRLSRLIGTPHLNFAGRTRLGTLAALLEKARLLVSNDTGVSHIADALDLPRIVIVAGSDPRRWQPDGRPNRRTLCYPVDCRPCNFLRCPIGHPCAERVGTEAVLEQAENLLKTETSRQVNPPLRCSQVL